jgi:hypothetical protein
MAEDSCTQEARGGRRVSLPFDVPDVRAEAVEYAGEARGKWCLAVEVGYPLLGVECALEIAEPYLYTWQEWLDNKPLPLARDTFAMAVFGGEGHSCGRVNVFISVPRRYVLPRIREALESARSRGLRFAEPRESSAAQDDEVPELVPSDTG